ncbi:uncharacterized protein LOC135429846 [Drosophila montana]|uniref:uncharacterized protein LOC135429846 n=1 Tax=Drosophila montana TaxID=40370 RepID=UPI00313CA7CF
MDKSSIKYLWLIPLCICLLNVGQANAIFMKFTNITCDSKYKNLATVEYCYIGQVDQLQNYMSLRYKIFEPIKRELFFHFRLMIRRNGWKPYLYASDIDMCRFWKSRYNGLAKLILGFLDGHTNMNHSCPYNENYIYIDRVMNTDISKRLPALPLGKGHYALFTRWSWKNVTRTLSNIYIEVTND